MLYNNSTLNIHVCLLHVNLQVGWLETIVRPESCTSTVLTSKIGSSPSQNHQKTLHQTEQSQTINLETPEKNTMNIQNKFETAHSCYNMLLVSLINQREMILCYLVHSK